MVTFDTTQLAEICARHDVRSLKLFGSALHGDATPESDVDLLVEFEGDKGLFDLVRLERDLEALLGRDVDLLTAPSLSRYFRDDVLATARPVYVREG
ncbi:MAG: nucleotidyltransferase family protein [Longimicrobiales bacterium]|nr:nucleotidyltransferase family protein [Longimicrobiales bacterium]